jgi:flavin reductase (DIM6/NTAB) family NADH-FMN oxidoreductase RutF
VVTFDPKTLDPQLVYKLLIGSVLPRPIAWVSTISSDGVRNIAPFSFFTVACVDPPMVCVSVQRPEVSWKHAKDTIESIAETREFVVNIATSELLDQVVMTAVSYPSDVDEFVVAKLTPVASDIVAAPRIAESPVNMECQLHQMINLGADVLVIGRVVRFHFRDDLLDSRLRMRVNLLRPLGRLAGPDFATEFSSVKGSAPIVESPRSP